VHPDPGRPRTSNISPGLTCPWLLSRIVFIGSLCLPSWINLGMLNWDMAFSWMAASALTALTVNSFQVTPSSRGGKSDSSSRFLNPTTLCFSPQVLLVTVGDFFRSGVELLELMWLTGSSPSVELLSDSILTELGWR
jgi:hypothetical protein